MSYKTMLIRPFEGFDERVRPFLLNQEMEFFFTISDDMSITEIIDTLHPVFSIDVFVISFHQKKSADGGAVNGLMVFDEIMRDPILGRRFESKRFILPVTQFGELTFRKMYYGAAEQYKNKLFILYESQMHQRELPARLNEYLATGNIIIPSSA